MAVRSIVVVPKPLEALPLFATANAGALDPEIAAIAQRISTARAEHAHAIATVRAILGDRDDVAWLETPAAEPIDGARLVVTIGGDGTFLTVARHAGVTPLLGVNSSPSTSTGHYCRARAETFAAVLDECLAGRAAPRELTRIRAEIDGARLPHDALNDVLFANRTPVSSTRYALRVGERTELQLSSGIWIATGSGSTAAILSAGGEVRPMTDPLLQWRVREPYLRDGPRELLAGLTESLEIVSRSDKNALYLDGHAEAFTVGRGARARLYRSPEPLLAYV